MEAIKIIPPGLSFEDAIEATVETYLAREITYQDCAERLRQLSAQHHGASRALDRTTTADKGE